MPTRTSSRYFDYPTHCLICATELDHEYVYRHHKRCSRICNVNIVWRDKTSIIQDTLLSACNKRNDPVAIGVRAGIEFAGNIRTHESKYHNTCMTALTSGEHRIHCSNSTATNVCNLNTENNNAFIAVCDWLNDGNHHQCSTLQDKRKNSVPSPRCSSVHNKIHHTSYDCTIWIWDHNCGSPRKYNRCRPI